jgi:uroporphyrinogen-III synthase
MVSVIKNKIFISTRPKGKSAELHELFMQNGAKHVEFPMISLSENNNNEEITQIIEQLKTYTYLAFTSANAFYFFYNKISQQAHLIKALTNIKIASIGYKTSESINKYGFDIAFDAHAKTGDEFAEKLLHELKGKKANVLWPTSNLSSNHLIEKLINTAHVTRLNIYKNSRANELDMDLLKQIKDDQYDMLICASPSAFYNLFKLTEDKRLKIACIGEITAKAAISYGVTPLTIAKEPNALGIFNAISEYYQNLLSK